jgi:hypothetical protein
VSSRFIAALLLLSCLLVKASQAHELPTRVVVRMIAAAEAEHLDLMVRVPLEAMRDVDFPLTPQGYLRLDSAQSYLEDAAGLWIEDNLELMQRGAPLAAVVRDVRAALPSDRAFASLRSARRHFAAPPLATSTLIFWRQAMLDVHLRYALGSPSEGGELTLTAGLRQLGETTVVELLYVEADGTEHVLSFDGDARDLALQPSARRVAGDFFKEGFRHILGGVDHLLFLLCLMLPMRRLWPLVKAITAFTVAHSVTLAAAALGWVPQALWFPAAVELVIALSIVYLALENILRERFEYRWSSALLFGLAHGFGFAAALRDTLQFAQGKTLIALAAFNLGVEAGQLLVIALVLPATILLLRRVASERVAIIVCSTLIAHTAWHWMTDRGEVLAGYFF